MDRKKFFDSVRGSLFNWKLTQSQVDGMNAILDLSWPLSGFAAYALATVYHECDQTMQPIVERGMMAYFNKYNVGTRIGKRLGNTQPGDGYKYRGRGFVQLTGRANYTKATEELGVDLVNFPEKALQLPISAKILYLGMLEGWFTGKKLADYITEQNADFKGARRIINGTDRANLIAGYAAKFNKAINEAL